MERSTERILTTHVGSLARPVSLLDIMKEKENDPAFKTRMDRAWNEHFTATGQHPTRQDLMPRVYNSLPQAEKRAFVDLAAKKPGEWQKFFIIFQAPKGAWGIKRCRPKMVEVRWPAPCTKA
jgi:hypothetical protein